MSTCTLSAAPDPNAAQEAPQPSGNKIISKKTVYEWLPIATRLDGLDDNGNPLRTVACRPLLPFSELPPHQVSNHKYDARVPPRVVRYGVPPGVKLDDRRAKFEATCDIYEQIADAHPGVDIGIITFTKKSGRTILDIHWISTQPYNTATPLKLGNDSLVFVAAAGRVEPTWITIVLREFVHPTSVSKHLKDFLYPHRILDYWMGMIEYTDETGTHRFGNGELHLLVELDMKEGEKHGLLDPNAVAASVPGYFAWYGEKYKLEYAARLNHCHFCKSTAFYEYHRLADCRAQLCSYCTDPGHPRRFCPFAKMDQADPLQA